VKLKFETIESATPVLLNRCCVFALDLESMFLAKMLKRLLQHNLPIPEIVTFG